jgi:hypothetical protein
VRFRAVKVAERVAGWLAVWFLALPLGAKAQAASGPTHHVSASLRMEDTAQCISAHALEARVEAQLGRAIFVSNPDVIITLRTHSEPEGLSLTMALALPDGRPLGLRTLHTPTTSCRALDDELALVLALLIDLPEEEIALLIPPDPEPSLISVAPPETIALASPVEGAVWVGVTPSLDALPGLAVALRAGAELHPAQGFSVEAGLGMTLPTAIAQGGAGASFWAWSFRAGGCGEVRFDALGLGGCGVVEVGTLQSEGFGLDVNRISTRLWFDVALALRIALRLGPVELRVAPGVVIPIVRDTFSYFNGIETISLYQPAIVSPAIDLLLAIPFSS